MGHTENYKITLEEGKAAKPFFELTEAERLEVGVRIFQKVTRLAAEVGAVPVVGKKNSTVSKRRITHERCLIYTW